MIHPGLWQTTNSHVAITHGFNFENSTVFGRFVTATWVIIGKNGESPANDTRKERKNAVKLTRQNKVSREAEKLELVREQKTMP